MSDSLILPKPPGDLPLPFLIVCEGYGDAVFIDKLLRANGIRNCGVGCPNRDTCEGLPGKTVLQQYLGALKFIYRKQNPPTLRGLLVVVDADKKPEGQFVDARGALEFAEFSPLPEEAFTVYEDISNNFRVSVFIMPGQDRAGTLEHIFLDAALDGKPELQDCLDKFAECSKVIPTGTANQQAKMRMSVLIGATCKENPWAPPSMFWHDKGNPVPIASSAFSHIVGFIREFAA